jgi:DNA-binding MarR family transcriptional regulator
VTPAIRIEADFETEFPGASATATAASVNLLRAASMLLTEINRHRSAVTDLSASGCQALAVLDGAGEPLSSTGVAGRLLVTTASVTSLLDTLERRELVRRVPHPSDRRKVLVEITDDGRAVIDQVMPMVHAANSTAMSALTERERGQLTRLMGRLLDHLGEVAGAELPSPQPRRLIRKR